MGKVYAKQVPPEYQESPLFLGDTLLGWPDNIIVDGNNDYNSHKTKQYEAVVDHFEEASYELAHWEWREYQEISIEEYLVDMFPPAGRSSYTEEEISRWQEILKLNSIDNRCKAISLITGKKYSYTCLRGCCQSEWNYMYYPVEDWTNESLCAFESEYFNTGTEWIVHDEENEPEEPDEINGFSMYCHSYDPKEEIAKMMGVDPSYVVLYEFDGFTEIAKYKIT